MKIMSIIGARPQFIKEAMMQQEILKNKKVNHVLVHTGQHYDRNMSGIFFDVLKMKKPDYNLGINGKSHGEMTAKMIIQIEKLLIKEKPDVILLYGDTNSTLAGAIAASKLKIKIAHIEAGLRQEPKTMPEEINRVLTDRISDFLFTPTPLANENLNNEGLGKLVYHVGDIMYDLFLKMKPLFDYSLLQKYDLEPREFVVMTLHRDFNVDHKYKLRSILKECKKIAENFKIVFPIHPRTLKRVKEFNLSDLLEDFIILPPIDYLKLMGLIQRAYKVITDSGGLQKEAYFSKKQALVIMPDTSWRELIDLEANTLVDVKDIYNIFSNQKKHNFDKNIFGDGKASKKIIDVLEKEL
ncbi:MAG: UDP-N-acetylglucosamine 2-epimerase (non-hydrolyzing) [Halanaerobiales bacterium]|nr:UDP-N-acetylglucosamine 2-epimerase (non-hydrolyzing) [Halanaerobiales bacterium]